MDLNKKITQTKKDMYLLKMNWKKLQTFDSSLFIGQNYFNNDRRQLFLVFQPIFKTFTTFSGLSDTISEW